MDTMIKELNQNSVYDWVQDMTIPLKPVQNDLLNRQYCSEPEPLVDQFGKMDRRGDVEIREFQLKYPNIYSEYLSNQKKELLNFIRNFEAE